MRGQVSLKGALMIEKLNEYILDDTVVNVVEGGYSNAEQAKLRQIAQLGTIVNFSKNTAGNNAIFITGGKTQG